MLLKTFLAFSLNFVITGVAAQADCSSKVDRLSIKDSAAPVKGKALQLNCIVNNFKNSSNIVLTRSDLQASEQITQCITSYCTNVPFKWRQSYTVSSDNNGVYLQIKSLNRSEDENTWICKNPCGESKSLQFTVHTVPQLLHLDSPLSQEEDLVHNAVTLKCSTGCAYPQPSFTWFYNETEDSRQEWASSGSVSNQAGGCTDSERIYTSTLFLPRYTTFPGNANKTVNFSCGITAFPGLTESLYTGSFVNVRFAVYATTPTITGHTTENRVVFENDTVTFECISSITRPVALVTWKKGSDILTDKQNTVTNHSRDLVSITGTVTVTLNRNDNNKNIICETSIPGQENKAYTQQGITVYWPPSTPSIPTTNLPFLEGQRGKSIYCQATVYGNPTATALWSSNYGTPNNLDSRQLDLPILSSQQDGMPASCQLKNQFTEKKSIQIRSPAIQIEVEYTPVVKILESSIVITAITRNEGQSISILCNARGNPVPTVRWIERTPNDEYLSFDDLDRRDHGTYTCKASAKSTKFPEHNFETEKKLNVVVNYAPVVTVDLSNTDPEEDTSLLISCNATGRPNRYNYTSVFQTWGTVGIPNTHLPANGIIDIKNLKVEDSGTYTCLVNNGIADRNNKLDQTGNVTVLIKASPKVLLEDTKFAGAIGKSVNITAPFYSHPDISQVEFRFQNGTKVTNSSKHGVYYKKNAVKDRFYGQLVELEGYIAVLQIMDEVEADFMNYTLILGNGIGSPMNVTLYHISESKPSVPKFFNYTGLVNGVPTFLLEGGFNGGRLQTFVIETAIAGSDKWVEQLRFSENDRNFLQKEQLIFIFNITGLGPNSYDVRARVGNDIDWIDDNAAPKISFTIPKEIKPTPRSSLGVIAGAVGSAVTVIIIAAVVIAVIIWKRRYQKRDESSTAINRRRQVDERDSSDDEVMTENLAYVSADEVSKKVKHTGADADSTYAQPHKTKKNAAFETGDLYSSVNKAKPEDPRSLYAMPVKKDQKNQKQKKQKEKAGKDLKTGKQRRNKNDDVYENASELSPIKTKKASEGRKEAYDENPYENPEESKPTQKKNVNKDGLIYADLTFNEQPKGQKKLVIHGLDSMTEYVEVDFTKKAEPLPDSDEETADKI